MSHKETALRSFQFLLNPIIAIPVPSRFGDRRILFTFCDLFNLMALPQRAITFFLNGRKHVVKALDADTTVLDYLRSGRTPF